MKPSHIASHQRNDGNVQGSEIQNIKVETPVSADEARKFNYLTAEIISRLEKDKSLPPKDKERLCLGTSISQSLMAACMSRKIDDIKYWLKRIENPLAEDFIRRFGEIEAEKNSPDLLPIEPEIPAEQKVMTQSNPPVSEKAPSVLAEKAVEAAPLKVELSPAQDEQIVPAQTIPIVETLHAESGEFHWVNPNVLKAHPRIENLYRIKPELLDSIKETMRLTGFDTRYPIQVVIIDGVPHIWDGFTRQKASLEVGLEKVYMQISSFPGEEELLLACVRNQTLRRSNDDATVLKSIELVEEIETALASERRKRKPGLSGQCCLLKNTTSLNIAKLVGKSETSVKHARKVLGSPEHRDKVFAGELTINKAYQEIMDAERPGSPNIGCAKPAARTEPVAPAAEHGNDDDQAPPEDTSDADSEDNRSEAPDAANSCAATKSVVTGTEKYMEPILIPVKFLQTVAACIDMNHVNDLLDVLGGLDSKAGGIFIEAIKGRKLSEKECIS